MTLFFNMTEEYNFKAICRIATTVLDMPYRVFVFKIKKRAVQVARASVAYIGMTENIYIEM
jgi:hypothetical protein